MLMSLEEAILHTIIYLRDKKHQEIIGILIWKTLRDTFGVKRVNGSIYKSLERMVAKGWLIAIPIKDKRRGNSGQIKHFQLTPLANKLLADNHSLWCKFQGIDESALAFASDLYIDWQENVYGLQV